MKIDAVLPPVPLNNVPETARVAEALGFSALWSTETSHDPFLPGTLIAEHTHHMLFGTAVAIAFARSPANLAYTAWDLAQLSNGRFILGLGTQVKAHIERRFGMSWPDSVAGKLREQISAVRAFWKTWQSGEPLNFRGEHYRLSLMSPFFNPGPIESPNIPIYIAGVNRRLAELAGEVADGFHVHPLHSPRYLKEILIPAIRRGAVVAGRAREDIRVCANVFVATSPEKTFELRSGIAFYASTPSYRAVMTLHGWQKTAEELSLLAARQNWREMPGLISDEILNEFAVIAPPEDLAEAIAARYEGLADRLTLYQPFVPGQDDSFWKGIIGHFI